MEPIGQPPEIIQFMRNQITVMHLTWMLVCIVVSKLLLQAIRNKNNGIIVTGLAFVVKSGKKK